jgi:hypothetical protein
MSTNGNGHDPQPEELLVELVAASTPASEPQPPTLERFDALIERVATEVAVTSRTLDSRR